MKLNSPAKVLVVAVHLDDETLGSGGALLKHKAEGDSVALLLITKVDEKYGFAKNVVARRNEEIKLVTEAYGFDAVYMLDYPPAGLTPETQGKMIKEISDVFNDYKPECVYIVNRSDAHSDHFYVFNAAYACTKTFRYPFIRKVLMYECISETEFAAPLPEKAFLPNYFVDITGFIEKKLEILNFFKSEIGEHPFPRNQENVRALAYFRGAMAGVQYAEAFQLLKFIDK